MKIIKVIKGVDKIKKSPTKINDSVLKNKKQKQKLKGPTKINDSEKQKFKSACSIIKGPQNILF